MRTLEGLIMAGRRGWRVAEAATRTPKAAALGLDARQRSCACVLQLLLLLPVLRTLLAHLVTCSPYAHHMIVTDLMTAV